MTMPMIYRIGAIFLIIVGLFSFGYYKGHSNEKAKFDAYKAEVAAAVATQEAKVKQIEKEATSINKDITNAYDRNLAAVRSHYQRLLDNQGSSKLPKVSSGSSRTHAGTSDELPVKGDLPGRCSETTLQLIYLQKWVKDQESNFNNEEN